ncbi:MAG: DNA-protecting protein DprA [Muribaculaceae bacterium]|nr:DNA-protecting protein DprA [Muribaculaceae bacterium]
MNQPLLSQEIILTLQQLRGIGNKTILSKIVSNVMSPISNLEDLLNFWSTVNGRLQSITPDDIKDANVVAKKIISQAEKEGVGIIAYYDREYPDILRQCTDEKGNPDPPLVLFFRGNIKALEMPGVAVIGTREPTPNGVSAGEYFAGELAKLGFNIVSGLAKGCDTSGHNGALKVNGVTTAFLANGLDWKSIYPKENLELAKRIVVNNGLLLSEYPIGQSCGRYGLVARDRLQAGMAKATIVVQTGKDGGSMHAVNATIASKKPLFAVEYKNEEDLSHEKVQGNIMLIRNKDAVPLSSKGIVSAVAIIRGANSKQVKVEQPSLFDPSI